MTALTTDTPRVYELGDINEFPIAANSIIYEGAAVGDNGAGYVRGLVTDDAFRGFADRHADNSNGSDGEKLIRIRKKGVIVLEIAGISLADVGKSVYALNDNTFTLSSGGTTYIGQLSRYDSAGKAVVDFNADAIKPIVPQP